MTGPGLVANVRGEGAWIICDLPSLAVGWSVLLRARQMGAFRLPLNPMLNHADVRLSFRIRGRVVAEAGPGIATGRLAGLFGLDGMRFRSFRGAVTP